MYILIGILLLGILIAVHEFGHFIAARLSGIEVMEFAIGMGPRICGWTGKSGTKFSLRCIPLGGYCAFYGEDDVEGRHKDDPRAYNKQNVFKRMFTVVMGPMMNFVLALVVAIGFYACTEYALVEPYLVDVVEGSPAWEAGLRPGDVITTVDGKDVLDGTTSTLSNAIDGSRVHELIVRRGEETFEATAATYWDEAEQKQRIGITFQGRMIGSVRLSFPEAVQSGWSYCVDAGSVIFDTLGKLFTDKEVLEQTTGPVGVVQVVSQEVRDNGWQAFVSLLVVISINLGIMNLLPIPGLDGSRFLFMVIEAVRGKPVKPEREAMVHMIGMVFLFAVMIFFTARDVWRIFQ